MAKRKEDETVTTATPEQPEKPPEQPSKVIENPVSGKFIDATTGRSVRVVQFMADVEMISSAATLKAKAGDYWVTRQDGSRFVVPAAEFAGRFKPVRN